MADISKVSRLWEDAPKLENYSYLLEILQNIQPVSKLQKSTLQQMIEQLQLWQQQRKTNLSSLKKPGTTLLPLVFTGKQACFRLLVFEEGGDSTFWQDTMRSAFREAVQAGYKAALHYISRFAIPLPSPHSLYNCRVYPLAEGGDPNLPIDEKSVALPAAVAFYSKWIGKPIPHGVVLTGDIVPQSGMIKAVRHVSTKLQSLISELPDQFPIKFIIPEESYKAEAQLLSSYSSRAKIVPARTLQEVLETLWPLKLKNIPASADSLQTSFDNADRDYKNHRHYEAALIYKKIIQLTENKKIYDRINYISNWRYGSTLNHMGEWKAARSYFETAKGMAEPLYAKRVISLEEYLNFFNNMAIWLSDAYRFDDAIRAMNRVIKEHESHTARHQLARAFGSRAQIYLLARRHKEAIRDYSKAITNFREAGILDELPRDYCWKGIALGCDGDRLKAIKAISRGILYNKKHVIGNDDRQKTNQQFLLYALTRIYSHHDTLHECRNAAEEALSLMGGKASWLKAMVNRYLSEALLSAGYINEAISSADSGIETFHAMGIYSGHQSKGGEVLYPLAATLYLLKSLCYLHRRNNSKVQDNINMAIVLIKKHRAAKHFFDEHLKRFKGSVKKLDIEEAIRHTLSGINY